MKQPAHQYYSSSSCQSQTVNSLERKPDKIDVSAAPKCIKSLQIEEARAPHGWRREWCKQYNNNNNHDHIDGAVTMVHLMNAD